MMKTTSIAGGVRLEPFSPRNQGSIRSRKFLRVFVETIGAERRVSERLQVNQDLLCRRSWAVFCQLTSISRPQCIRDPILRVASCKHGVANCRLC